MVVPKVQRMWLAWLRLLTMQSGLTDGNPYWVRPVRNKMIELSQMIDRLEVVDV